MKANELMAGDWVMTPNGIARVIMIGEHSPCYTTKTGEGEAAIFPRDLHPIQLTAEVLEKNGFKKDYNGDFELIEEGYGIRVVRRGDVYAFTLTAGRDITDMVRFAIHQVGPFSVHWVQHALKLCGIELEIKL